IRVGGALGGEPRRHAFERRHDRDDLDDFALGLFNDIDAAPRPGADKALLFEQCHRLADRRAADPEALRQPPLVEPDLLRLAVNVHRGDRPLQGGVSLLREAGTGVQPRHIQSGSSTGANLGHCRGIWYTRALRQLDLAGLRFASESPRVWLRTPIDGTNSTEGPVPTENAWDAFADDQLGLMDHLGIREFFFMGYCIGGCFAGKLLQRAPDRVVAAVFHQTVGDRPEDPGIMYRHSTDNWLADFKKRRPEVSQDTIDKYFHSLWRAQPDFLYSVSRDFIKNCRTPILVLPDDTPSHP